MPKASEIKKNAAVEYNGQTYIVRDIEKSVPQGRSGGSLFRMRMYDVVTNNKIDETFKDSDTLELADLEKQPVTFSYTDGDECVFMNSVDYTSYSLDKSTIEDELLFINETTPDLQIVIINDSPVGLELPTSVELEIIETDPKIKGGTATSRSKPATLSTGLTLSVPEHISVGDVIKINVEERKFQGRADK